MWFSVKFLDIKEEKYKADRRYWVLEGKIQDMGFEILFYENKEIRMLNKMEKIEFNGLSLNILPLKYARKFYKLMNRSDRVKLIEKYLRH